MPTPSSDPLAACEKEFNEARSALAAVQRANRESSDAESRGKLLEAQRRFISAGQALRRELDPDRAHEINEFNRYLAEKARIRARRAKQGVMGHD